VTIEDWSVALLPVRVAGHPVALLAAVLRRLEETASPEWIEPGPPESAARAWRDALEGDLASVRRLRGQEQHAHRSRAQASFVADLQQCKDEADLLNALLQAIAVWHDVEPCAYNRDLGGHFALRATLPGTDLSTIPDTLEAAVVMDAAAAEGAGAWPLLTQLGWRTKGAPMLLLVSSGSLEEWLIAISGAPEPDLGHRLEPLLKGFPAGLERVREREARQLRHQLWESMVFQREPHDVQTVGAELLATIGQSVEATHGLLAVGGDAQVPAAAGAPGMALSTRDAQRIVRDGFFSADALSIAFPLPQRRSASLELRRADRRAFRACHATALLAVRPMLGAWLSGIGPTDEWSARFAAEDAPRVLRFLESANQTLT
jgi:hypothetical protein